MTIERVSQGVTIKARTQDHKFYMTINHDEQGKINEIFVRLDDAERFELVMVVTRLVSMALREGVDPLVVADELMAIHSPVTKHFIPGTDEEIASITARIGKILKDYIKEK